MSDRTTAEQAVEAMQTEAFNFGTRWITDAGVRSNYLTAVHQYARDVLDQMQRGEITPQQAAEQAGAMRNHFLDLARLKSSDIGRATAEQLKPKGVTLDALLERYAMKQYSRPFQALGEGERNSVYLAIVEASGRPNASVTLKAIRFGRLGKGLLVLSLAIAVYDVATADDKVDAAAREGVGLGGGFLGGAAGGALAGLACGPGAPVCVTIGVFVGGAMGALGADHLYGWIRH